MPSQAPDVRNKNFDEVALGYTQEQAMDEAQRCLQLQEQALRLRLPGGHPHPRLHPEVAAGRF